MLIDYGADISYVMDRKEVIDAINELKPWTKKTHNKSILKKREKVECLLKISKRKGNQLNRIPKDILLVICEYTVNQFNYSK